MIDQLVDCVIRPPRSEYSLADLLGPQFSIQGKEFVRNDLQLVNSRGDVLECSHYVPYAWPPGEKLPCVIYCHGNSGCRVDANQAAAILLPANLTVFTLDFSGSGMSGGKYVTLGFNEMDDLTTVVDHLRVEGRTSLIGLWGRSMGAVTALFYGASDPSIAGMVLDSPFSSLNTLVMELVDKFKVKIPKFGIKLFVQYMRRVIRQRANFDIQALDCIPAASKCFIPVLIGHGEGDEFILPHHSDLIHNAYAGDKNVIKFVGDHNSPRPTFFFHSLSIFYQNTLDPPESKESALVDYSGTVGLDEASQSQLNRSISRVPMDLLGMMDDPLGDEIDQLTMYRLLESSREEGIGMDSGVDSELQCPNRSPGPLLSRSSHISSANQEAGLSSNSLNLEQSQPFFEDDEEEQMLQAAIALSLSSLSMTNPHKPPPAS